MMNDITLAGEVVVKIISGMFFHTEGMVTLGLFTLVGVVFYLKSKLEHN